MLTKYSNNINTPTNPVLIFTEYLKDIWILRNFYGDIEDKCIFNMAEGEGLEPPSPRAPVFKKWWRRRELNPCPKAF